MYRILVDSNELHAISLIILFLTIQSLRIVFLPDIDQICPLKFYDDEIYGLPYIKSIPMNCMTRDQLLESLRSQQFLISLNGEEPIHIESAMEEFTRLLTTHANKLINITLSMRKPEITKESYPSQRAKFDQVQPVIASNVISSTQLHPPTKSTSEESSPQDYVDINAIIRHYIPTVQYLIHSVQKPQCPKYVIDYFQPTNVHHIQWKETAFEQYYENASYKVFSKPIPMSTLPINTDILRSVLTPSVKPTDIQSIWKFGLRHCVNSKPLKGNERYDPTFAPTVSPLFFRFQLCYSAAHNF